MDMETNKPFTLTADDTAAIEFLLLARTRLDAKTVDELDTRIARHANRIAEERGIDLESAVIEATAQAAHEIRDRVRAAL